MLDFLILGLATWRVASLFVNEKGPFNIFVLIREEAGIQHDKSGDPFLIPGNFFAQVLSCVWCFSAYSGIFWMLVYKFLPFWDVLAYPFAFSAIAVIVQTHVSKEYN